jgi:hypothetical protein
MQKCTVIEETLIENKLLQIFGTYVKNEWSVHVLAKVFVCR